MVEFKYKKLRYKMKSKKKKIVPKYSKEKKKGCVYY